MLSLFLFSLLYLSLCSDSDLDNVCLATFHVEKYTLASSDSYRDNENTLLIFPSVEAEYAPHFQQDLCARQSKCSIPYTCFKLHSPQTDQHEEGYLSIEALEHQYSMKFYSVIHGIGRKFDAFFDYNLGIWVASLNKYLERINSHSDILTNYIGLKWHYPHPIDKTFYSLIINSPSSQIVYELMSFNEPDLSSYPNLRKNFEFTPINELRASFLSYDIANNEYPWNSHGKADIVPIKISFGCSNLAENIEFYVNVLEAQILYQRNRLSSSIDGHIVSYAFLKPIGDDVEIEIEFVERPIAYTYGTFTTALYRNLLSATHFDRITSATCGLDRWFDNHYSFNTVKFAAQPTNYNYLDRVLSRLIQRQRKYRLYKTPYQFESPEGKYWMEQFDMKELYTLYVFDMNGQTIQMFGAFRDYNIPLGTPIYNKQWCYSPCPGNQMMGDFDQSKVYKEDETDRIFKIIVEENRKYQRNGKESETNAKISKQDIFDQIKEIPKEDVIESSHEHKAKPKLFIAIIGVIGFIGCLTIIFCIFRYFCCKMMARSTGDNSFDQEAYDAEISALLHKK